jgi:hypothetical protein
MKAEKIAEVFKVSRFSANFALLIMRGRVDVEAHPSRFPSTCEWIRRCHNRPGSSEIKMEALDELLGGCGVEAIEADNFSDTYYGNFAASYVNLGDSYVTTIVLCHRSRRFILMSMGDYVETYC